MDLGTVQHLLQAVRYHGVAVADGGGKKLHDVPMRSVMTFGCSPRPIEAIRIDKVLK
jgi:hypothetical protein